MAKVKVEELKCKDCGSEHIVKHQKIVTKGKGERQRFKCQKCGSTFYDDGEKE